MLTSRRVDTNEVRFEINVANVILPKKIFENLELIFHGLWTWPRWLALDPVTSHVWIEF